MKMMTLEDVEKVPAGDSITLTQTNGTINVWTRHDDGMFVFEGTRLPASSFANSAGNGKVFTTEPGKVGDGVQNNGQFHVLIYRDHDEEVWASFNDRWMWLGNSNTPKLGTPADISAEFRRIQIGLATDTHMKMILAERLDKIVATGEIPPEVKRIVTVEVTGSTEMTPDQRQATRLLGVRDVAVVNVKPVQIDWKKTVQVEATTRWGCACDTVNEELLASLRLPGEVGKFQVVTCTEAATD